MVFALMCFFVAASTVSQENRVHHGGAIKPHSFYSTTLDRELHYTVYFPPDFGYSERYPVIYLLHGRGDTMASWRQVTPTLDRLIATEAIPPMIAVMPDASASNRAGYYVDGAYTGDSSEAQPAERTETALVDDLVAHIESTYPVVTHRSGRALAGYSMGGYGAVRYLFAYPQVFSAAIVLSPAVYTPLPPEDSSAREYGAFGTGERLFDADRYTELNYPALLTEYSGGRYPTRVFIAVGDDEWRHPNPDDALHDLDVEAHLLFSRLSRVNGVSAEFRVYDGGHDWDVWKRGLEEGLRDMADHLRLSTYR
jgi:enterochelin esterase-like enzyme